MSSEVNVKMDNNTAASSTTKLIISFRSKKIEMIVKSGMSITDLKFQLSEKLQQQQQQESLSSNNSEKIVISPYDIKLMYKGKVLNSSSSSSSKEEEDVEDVLAMLVRLSGKSKKVSKVYRIMASGGMSNIEIQQMNDTFYNELSNNSRRIKDDLTNAGQMEQQQRQRMGNHILQEAATRYNNTHNHNNNGNTKFGFNKIESLPNLPNQSTANEILQTLANDPGILSCMKKHSWLVGSLCELYPKGNVGHSPVCVMGLNQNNGQKIFLRLRTDDLQGFRPMLSIKKVLFHELAHNVHSEHNNDFFQLMRQIEKECNEMDWTKGNGLSSSSYSYSQNSNNNTMYTGGTYRLGGVEGERGTTGGVEQQHHQQQHHSIETKRELAAQAAMARMTPEEEEIQQNCGCGYFEQNLFLPK